MTTHAPVQASRLPDVDVGRLIADIEAYLASQAPTVTRAYIPVPAETPSEPRPAARTAHPLVTKTTAELVAEATGHAPAPVSPQPALSAPGRVARLMPHALLRVPGVRRMSGGVRPITVEQHIALTALIIERGWARHTYRTISGRMCMQGAQRLLHRLGYGDDDTANQAAHRIQKVLTGRGIRQPYPDWNDGPDRSVVEVLHLLRTAAAAN